MRGNGSMSPAYVRSEGLICMELADLIRSPSLPIFVNRILTRFGPAFMHSSHHNTLKVSGFISI
jgi:hypothetical protein